MGAKLSEKSSLVWIMSTTTSLAVVGSGLVAWQAFNLAANLRKDKAGQAVDCAAEDLRQKWSRSVVKDPEFITIPSTTLGTHYNDVQQEFKSILRFRPWKLLRNANAGDHTVVRDLSSLSKELSDGEMRQLAQALSRKTAIWLASRTGMDQSRINCLFHPLFGHEMNPQWCLKLLNFLFNKITKVVLAQFCPVPEMHLILCPVPCIILHLLETGLKTASTSKTGQNWVIYHNC